MKRSLNIRDMLNQRQSFFPFEGEWKEAFGQPDNTGIWFVFGSSGNGKTTFVLQMVKNLSKWSKVVYNSLEEGTSLSMVNAIKRAGFTEKDKRVLFVEESITDLTDRLNRRNSPGVVVIDSFQYTQLTYKDYLEFKKKFKNKLIIFVSHADGKSPAGRSAKSVRYDAALKIWIEGYRAFSQGRFKGPAEYFTIWEEGAAKTWGKETNQNSL